MENDYIIVKVTWPQDTAHLELIVNELMREGGYTPIGGVVILQDQLSGTVFMQSMYRNPVQNNCV